MIAEGLQAKKLEKLLAFYTSNSVTDEKAILYDVASQLTISKPRPDHTEQLAIKKIAFKEALGMIFDGQITDSLTIIGILMLKEKITI